MNNINLITKNKKAYFDYDILSTYEAWIELRWYEVKSIRLWQVNLKWSYISNIWWFLQIKWMHITPYKVLVNRENIESMRDRKIFLHKKDIFYILNKQKESGLAVISLEVYFKWSLIKLKVWLCKWRKEYDKKQVLKERTLDKEAKIMMSKFNF